MRFDYLINYAAQFFLYQECNEDTLIICVVEYYGETFSSHFNAFVIKSRGVVSAINVYSLADHRPFYARFNFSSSDEALYITLPYYY